MKQWKGADMCQQCPPLGYFSFFQKHDFGHVHNGIQLQYDYDKDDEINYL